MITYCFSAKHIQQSFRLVAFLAALALLLLSGSSAGAAPPSPVKLVKQGTSGFPVASGNFVYFVDNHGAQLWRTDGSSEGTVLIKDLRQDPSFSSHSRIGGLIDVQGTLFFLASDDVHGRRLWKTNGDPVSAPAMENFPYATDLTNFHGTLLFMTDEEANNRKTLWRSDGSARGTYRLKTIPAHYREIYSEIVVVGKYAFFIGPDDNNYGYQLWKTDGTAAGTIVVRDFSSFMSPSMNNAHQSIRPALGEEVLPYAELADVNGMLFFTVTSGDSSNGLWKSDGTPEGTLSVKRFSPSGIGLVRGLTNVNGRLFFSADDGIHGSELWQSDGTEQGTTLVADIHPGAGSAVHYGLTNVNGTLYFKAFDGIHGRELWKSDGTKANTTLVKDIAPDASSSDPTSLINVNGILYFVANDGTHGEALWRSDGSAAGTVLVHDATPDVSDSIISQLVNAGGILFFGTRNEDDGASLWATSPTAPIDLQTTLPSRINAQPQAEVTIPLAYRNTGLTTATAVSLTVVLDPRLVYLNDTFGIPPTIQSNTLAWNVPDVTFLEGRSSSVRVRLPAGKPGERYPVTLKYEAVGEDGVPFTRTQQTEILIAEFCYLPFIIR